ncbi:MAG: hypothetical protein QF660_01590 [Anaerolineales bacterium]|nr:hypothetical protein [Anaerolineales bacterium]
MGAEVAVGFGVIVAVDVSVSVGVNVGVDVSVREGVGVLDGLWVGDAVFLCDPELVAMLVAVDEGGRVLDAIGWDVRVGALVIVVGRGGGSGR